MKKTKILTIALMGLIMSAAVCGCNKSPNNNKVRGLPNSTRDDSRNDDGSKCTPRKGCGNNKRM